MIACCPLNIQYVVNIQHTEVNSDLNVESGEMLEKGRVGKGCRGASLQAYFGTLTGSHRGRNAGSP